MTSSPTTKAAPPTGRKTPARKGKTMINSEPTAPEKAAGDAAQQLSADPTLRVVALDEVIPYWRNPRIIHDDAVNAVAESISRYGYLQPIVTDANLTIIVGHTRYMALRRLGYTKVPVRVDTTLTQSQVQQLRVIDNKAREFTSWNHEKLLAELGELDAQLMGAYFPEIDPSRWDQAAPDEGDSAGVPSDVIEEHANQDPEVEFVCPSCFHSWEMPVTRQAIWSGKLEVKA